ncbi:serine/threonine protein kinase [Pseudanabaena sp. FACHB-1277]|uniref:non-specific serine/threonine protein kinase n=1 Tax=Pseudanabaena cinerea FACHB-1277 TaxID=2949581 RepID=A0A926UVP9_9CYAN|nr:serine/threonine-protein kinase [Pseudanabaena cinerea]MBD2152117.1 serine/threonine protein kinase [Pseudanabaena cinerea FACHB-1277]
MPAKVLDGRYKLIKQIGAGGFGHTFIARDMRRPGSPPCVVKQLKPASDDPNFIREARRLFNTEAETLEKLGRHDQIPQLLAYFEEDQQFFLVQEFVEGRSLHDEMKMRSPEPRESNADDIEALQKTLANIDEPPRDKQLEELTVLQILKDVLQVLEFVHSEGVIHRDIKPDNLIRRKQDQKIVLIDFGAVKAVKDMNTKLAADEKGESRFTVTIGTPGYMPSEQCAGRPNYTSDIYALGMVAIKALTGYAPTDLPTDPATGEVVWRDKARVSNGLAMVLTRMVRYHYTQRYQSVRDVQQGINTFANLTEVERQATTSKLVRSTSLTTPETGRSATSRSEGSTSRRTVPATSSNSNAGVFLLFGGLLVTMGVIAALVLPNLRNKPPSVIVREPNVPISQPIANPINDNTATAQLIDQLIKLVPNQGDVTIANKISGKITHSYRFEAKAGQFLKATLAGSDAVMTVLSPQNIGLPNSVNVTGTELLIANDGVYTVVLRSRSGQGDAAYQLQLGLKDNTIATPAPTPAATPNLPPPNAPIPTPPLANTPAPTAPATTAPATTAPATTAPPPPQIEIKIRNR